jgi:DNA-binding GntR family transcriptional regulator
MTQTHGPDLIADLFAGSVSPVAASTAERVVDVLRGYLIEGRIVPGTRLSEEAFANAMSVSRNTLREAFRILAHEKLLVHEMNRGVFVRELSVADVTSIYQFRTMLETSALLRTETHTPSQRSRIRLAVTEGLAAAEAEDWRGLGTANMHFHSAIAGLAANRRLDGVMSQLLAEQRLAFHVMTPLKDFHYPYLTDNQRICELIEAGDVTRAAEHLAAYLDRACAQMVAAFEAST